MRHALVAACAASLLILTACTAETSAPTATPTQPTAADPATGAPSTTVPEGPAASAELETIRINVLGMG